MPTAAELNLVLRFRDEATRALQGAIQGAGQAAASIGRAPVQAFRIFEEAVNRVNSVIRLTRRFLFEVTLALAPFIGALTIASQNNALVAEQFRRIQNAMRDMATQIGIRLLPLLEAFASWVENNAPKIVDFFDQLPRHIARALLQIASMLAAIAQDISSSFPKAAEAILSIVRALQGAARASRDFAFEIREAIVVSLNTGNQIAAGIRIAVDEARQSISNLKQQTIDFTKSAITGLQNSFESLFTSLITRSVSAKEAFRNFALGILQMVAQMIARFIAMAIILAILNRIPGFAAIARTADVAANVGAAASSAAQLRSVGQASKQVTVAHSGGLIRSYQTGGEVPALLDPGEFVVRRSVAQRNLGLLERMNQGEPAAGGITNIFVIQATDADSFKAKIAQNADLIESIFQRAIRRNSGPMREAVRI